MENMKIDRKDKCKCDKPHPQLVNYDWMWHDGDVICESCRKFIRYYDAG